MSNWRYALLLLIGLGLAGCNFAPHIPAIPFKAGLPDQVAVMEFKLIVTDPFLLGLLVNWPEEIEGETTSEWLGRTNEIQKIFQGEHPWGHGDGVLLPLQVRVFRNGQLIINERIETIGSSGGISFCFDNQAQRQAAYQGFWKTYIGDNYGLHCEKGTDMRRVGGIRRAIKYMALSPGAYRVEVATVQRTEAFVPLDLYLTMRTHDPKI